MRLYNKLADIAANHISVLNSRIIYLPSGEPQKLRIYLIDNTILDVWCSIPGKYSFHWDRRLIKKGIYRFDNAPHKKWKNIKTFPKHQHFYNEEDVKESHISEKPDIAIKEILGFIESKLIEEQID